MTKAQPLQTVFSRRVLHSDFSEDPVLAVIAEVGGLSGPGGFFGTQASTPKGRSRVLAILKTAKDMVLNGGFANLSLREVSRRAGFSLSHVQYYFKSYEDLQDALIVYIMAIYTTERTQREKSFGSDPIEQFRNRMRWILSEGSYPEAAAFFFEFWSLSLRSPSVRSLMERTYQRSLARQAEMISSVNPGLDAETVAIRAGIILATAEGMLILFSSPGKPLSDRTQLIESAAEHLLQMALA